MRSAFASFARPTALCWSLALCAACAAPVDDADTTADTGQQEDALGDASADNDVGVSSPVDVGAPECKADPDCPASKACSLSRCILGSCVLLEVDGLGCDDGAPCTVGDRCAAGKCTPGPDLCECQQASDCAVDDLCKAGAICDKSAVPYRCKPDPSTAVSCDKGKDSACVANNCDPKTGKCAMTPRNDGLACSDGDQCTVGEICAAGKCGGGASVCLCQDNKDCAALDDGDLCNGTLYCDKDSFPFSCRVNKASVVACSGKPSAPCLAIACEPKTGKCGEVNAADQSDCTEDGSCLLGACKSGKCVVGKTPVCACKTNGDCAGQDDGDKCNGTMYCDLTDATPHCKPNPATVIHCPSVADTHCVKNVCYPASGKCKPTETRHTVKECAGQDCSYSLKPPGAATTTTVPCDDGDPCTKSDTCDGAVCKGKADVCPCKADSDCAKQDDGNLCNGTMYCDSAKGTCAFNPATVVNCATVDNTTCSKLACQPKTGKCAKTPVGNAIEVCEDNGKPGTSGKCRWEVKAAGEVGGVVDCDDGDPCTKGDVCVGGSCAAGPSQCECKVNADCAAKDDGDICNGIWVCDKSGKLPKCAYEEATKVICGDQPKSACLKKKCLPKTGVCQLQAVNEAGPCDDDEPCTMADKCATGECKGIDNKCDDNNLCTQDLCVKTSGCVHKKVGCDDGNDCTVDTCNPSTGQCVHDKAGAEGKSCNADDNPCTPLDTCKQGACKAGQPFICTGKTGPCQKAVCVPSVDKLTSKCAVVARDDGEACAEDGKGCTIGASCQGGACAPGSIERFHVVANPGSREVRAVGAAGNGEVFAVGGTGGQAVSGWWASRLKATSKNAWTLTINNQVAGVDARAEALVVSQAAITVAGTTATTAAARNVQVAVLGHDGKKVWVKDFGNQGVDEGALAVAVRDSGAVATAGWRGKAGTRKTLLMRMSSTGGYIWAAEIPANGGWGSDLRFRDDGGLVFVGCRAPGGKCVGVFGQVAANGTVEGNPVEHQHAGGLTFGKMAKAKDGWIVAATAGSGASQRAAWLRLEKDGKLVFKRLSKLHGQAMGITAIGPDLWAISGATNPSGGNDNAALFAIDGRGNRQWLREIDGGGTDWAMSVAGDGPGGLVTGGRRDVDGKRAGFIARTDGFGHTSCTTAGGCAGKAASSCADGKVCTADDCSATSGCVNPAVDSFTCDPADGCSIDGKCDNGACKPAGKGRLFTATVDSATETVFAAAIPDGSGYAVLGYEVKFKTPAMHLWRLDEKGDTKSVHKVFTAPPPFYNTTRAITATGIVPRHGGGWVVSGTIVSSHQKAEWLQGKIVLVNANGSVALDMKDGDIASGCSLPNHMVGLALYPDGTIGTAAPCGDEVRAMRFDSTGKVQWHSKAENWAQTERPVAMTVSIAGELAAVGYVQPTKSPTNRGGHVVLFDKDGKVQWQRSYAHGTDSWFTGVVADGNEFLVTGVIGGTQQRAWLLRLSQQGEVLQSQAFSDGKLDLKPSGIVAQSGGWALVGTASEGILDSALILGVDKSFRQRYLATRKHGTGTRTMSSQPAAAIAGSDLLVVGATGPITTPIPWLARLDAFGHFGCDELGGCGGKKPGDCSDNNPCTLDTCAGPGGCKHLQGDCGDGNPCTVDSCDPKKGCVHTNQACDDGNPCTADTCDPAVGCSHRGGPCEGGNKCTQPACDPALTCPGKWFGGRCFEVISQKSSFNGARAHCAKDGRQLAVVRTAAENEFLWKYAKDACIGNPKFTMLRLGFWSPTKNNQKYEWLDKSPVTFTRWSYGSAGDPPSNAAPGVIELHKGRWFAGESNLDQVSVYKCFACSGVPKVSCKQKNVPGCTP